VIESVPKALEITLSRNDRSIQLSEIAPRRSPVRVRLAPCAEVPARRKLLVFNSHRVSGVENQAEASLDLNGAAANPGNATSDQTQTAV